MPASGLSFASASPCIVAIPIRNPVNDPGPDATANRSTSAMRRPCASSSTHQIPRQTLAVCDCRVADVRRKHAAIAGERHAPLPGCRVEGEHQHVKFNSTCLPPPFDGAQGAPSVSRGARSASPAGHAPSVTPAMRQYLDAKQQYRDAILFFRMGDFYEMFYEDALVAARALDLTLTSRSKDGQGTSIPMCGVPHHALDTYLARLVAQGLSRRHLRSSRRSEKSQGHRQA